MAESVLLTIDGDKLNVDTDSFDSTGFTSSQTVVLDRPGDQPYLTFAVEAAAGVSEDGPVADLIITTDILGEFGIATNTTAISDFSLTDTNGNILYYWAYDNLDTQITDGATNLQTDYYFRVQLKRRSDDSTLSVTNISPQDIQLRRFSSTNNLLIDTPPSTTTDISIDNTTFTAYHPTGTWTSPVIDLKETPVSLYSTWTSNDQSATRIDTDMSSPSQIEYRVADSIDPAASSIGAVADASDNSYDLYPIDAITSGSWVKTVNGIDLANKGRYVQFKVTFLR
jgi:hypothetical protein